MKITIDDQACIACGMCEDEFPQYFGIVDGKVMVKDFEPANGDHPLLKKFAERCPGGGIRLEDFGIRE